MPIDRIRATAHRQPRDVSDLVQSIREVGLLQPLVVDSEGNLLAGYHRYLALRELGWEEVPVVVVELDALRAELATLDENIVRNELTELERAEMEARRREIYETLYPLARYGARRNIAQVERGGLNQDDADGEDLAEIVSARYESESVNDDESADLPPPYTRYAAEREGVTDRTVRNRLRIAEKLHPEVRDYIRGTPLADDQRGLLRLTRLEDPELQLAAARLIVEEGAPPRLAVERVQRMAAQVDTPTLEGQDPLLPPEIVYVRGDFRDGLAQLPDGSVQLILTDPPYAEDALPLYEELARHAARVLEEGGSLICYVGHHLLPRAAQVMGQHLRYWWALAVAHSSATQTIYGKNVWVRWKPALWFVRGGRATSDIVSDLIDGTPPDKTPHPWAQGVDEVRPLIRALTTPGGLVLGEGRYAAGRGWLMERYAAHVGREEVVDAAAD
jgi:ParB-like chromosome segregation protein Spo0J